MSILKYGNRMKRIDYFIRAKATGPPMEFSKKLCVSRSQLLQDIREMRELGLPIKYCHQIRSYIYEFDFPPLLGLQF